MNRYPDSIQTHSRNLPLPPTVSGHFRWAFSYLNQQIILSQKKIDLRESLVKHLIADRIKLHKPKLTGKPGKDRSLQAAQHERVTQRGRSRIQPVRKLQLGERKAPEDLISSRSFKDTALHPYIVHRNRDWKVYRTVSASLFQVHE